MRLLITGGEGMLARALRAEAARAHEVIALSHAQLDVTDPAAVRQALERARPHAVLHCAAYTRVDDAEREQAQAFALNAEATAHVAEACRELGARLVYPSSDYVFAGDAARPYTPADPPAPGSAYGRSKLAGEEAAAGAGDYLVVRTAWLYGAGGRNFVSTILARARAGEPLRVVNDQRGSPTWTGDLARIIVSLLEIDAPSGIYHATSSGVATWYELARAALELARIDARVEPVATADYPTAARRPAYSVLDCAGTSALVGPMREWREALREAIGAGGL